MEIKDLQKTDVGRWVEHQRHGTKVKGRIKSWNEHYIFVVYHCDGQWDHYKAYTAAATRPNELHFTQTGRK